MDIDDGYILWTGIWKGSYTALHNDDVLNSFFLFFPAQLLEIRKVRGRLRSTESVH